MDSGLVWTVDGGSVDREKVWARLPHEEVPVADPPEGYTPVSE